MGEKNIKEALPAQFLFFKKKDDTQKVTGSW